MIFSKHDARTRIKSAKTDYHCIDVLIARKSHLHFNPSFTQFDLLLV